MTDSDRRERLYKEVDHELNFFRIGECTLQEFIDKVNEIKRQHLSLIERTLR